MCVQYIGGCSVHWGDTMTTSGGYHEYIGGCSVHWGIPWVHRGISRVHQGISWCMLRGYHESIGRCLAHWGIPRVHWGDIMSTSGDTTSTLGDVQYIGVFNRNWKVFTNLLPICVMISPSVLNIPQCTYDIPTCILISPQCTVLNCLRYFRIIDIHSWSNFLVFRTHS